METKAEPGLSSLLQQKVPRALGNYGVFAILLPLLALVMTFAFPKLSLPVGSRMETIDDRTPIDCSHNYSIEILSLDPVVLYINNFLKDQEINHLVHEYSKDLEHSLVYDDNLSPTIDRSYRTSDSARIPHADPVASCLTTRMHSFLGNIQHIDIEPLQLVRYDVSERFKLHYDWFYKLAEQTHLEHTPNRPYNRFGTIFAYLGDNCTGGEAYFPDIKGVASDADGEKFSRTDTGMGLLVKPKKGNAIFWNNMHMNGSGDYRVVHAGLPVHSGQKIGLNMFSYYYPDYPIVGGNK
ncbi:hypothetical protein CGMCC3_g15921 [Colletotrichum fructicola]|uniref:2og-fe oxygenase family protein n=1 Tax=Colletotrichum fructicola (strain Nara gc5) TaxID=1213859 RepID=L2G697_COLFN|nr:uncharacterized protein CGMCC3_g15921 [Colletotrichum fructicola]KAE9567957.1 hypothetical protein CGMCC3_g15921 [Colletotrichum fructicola]